MIERRLPNFFVVFIQAISAVMVFDPKLIPLFDRSDFGQSVMKWIEKAELICQLSAVKRIECVVPMCLSGRVYVVYQQLSKEKKSDFTCIKNASYTAFTLDSNTAWKQLIAHTTYTQVRLSMSFWLVGSMTDWSLMHTFITGLPEYAEELL